MLNVPVVNLGFTVSGRAEPSVARAICSIKDPAAFILDCDANCGDTELKENVPAFLEIIRNRYPDIPILVLSRISFAKDFFTDSSDHRIRRAEFQKELVNAMKRNGDANIFFQDGKDLLGRNGEEGTVDGVHPNDFGFWSMAQNLEPVIRSMLTFNIQEQL